MKTGLRKSSHFTAEVSKNGRITIPSEMRSLWNLADFDYVELEIVQVQKRKEA